MYNRVASPTNFIPEQEYNFRVKVNYQNGFVTVHGPPPKVVNSPRNQPIHYINPGSIRQSICLPQQHHAPLQTHFISKNISPIPTFSESTQSRSQGGERSPKAHFRINYCPPQQNKNFQMSSNKLNHQESLTTKVNSPSTKLEQSSQSSNQQIHCVLCERNFKIHEFQYHLDLHRGRKKQQDMLASQPIIQNNCHVQSEKRNSRELMFINQSSIIKSMKSQKSQKIEAPLQQNTLNPTLLYTFHHQNNSYQTNNHHSSNQSNFSNSSYQQHSRILSFQSNKQPNIHHSQMLSRVSSASQYTTPLNSVHSFRIGGQQQNSFQKNEDPIISPTQPSNIEMPLKRNCIENMNMQSYSQSNFEKASNPQLNSRIRYIVGPNIENGGHQVLSPRIKQSGERRNLTQSASAMSSQKSNLHKQKQIAPNLNINNSNQMKNLDLNNSGSSLKIIEPDQHKRLKNSEEYSINPFDLIEKEQSKIYDQFPESRRFSSFNQASKVPKRENQEKQFKTLSFQKNFIQKVRKINSINNNRNSINYEDDISQSSISSIRSDKQPLESLNRQQLIQVYHSKRKPMDFTNIIGMSQMLAKGGYEEVRRTNQQIQFQMQKNKIISHPRISTAKSMVFGEYKKEESSVKANTEMEVTKLNLEMMGLQNKKVFRGTQVQQNDLRSSMMNLTRSSKSSAKTKLPKNYLAVPEFLHESSRLA